MQTGGMGKKRAGVFGRGSDGRKTGFPPVSGSAGRPSLSRRRSLQEIPRRRNGGLWTATQSLGEMSASVSVPSIRWSGESRARQPQRVPCARFFAEQAEQSRWFLSAQIGSGGRSRGFSSVRWTRRFSCWRLGWHEYILDMRVLANRRDCLPPSCAPSPTRTRRLGMSRGTDGKARKSLLCVLGM